MPTATRKGQLKALHEMRPGPGARQAALRIGVQIGLVAIALWAWQAARYPLFALLACASGIWYGGAMSLTHDALHHRLTGLKRVDDAIARAIAWPLGWPIGVYGRVHLIHHRWAGGSFDDPERLQPTTTEYARASWIARWYFRNQVWFNIFVAGGIGLLVRLLADAWRHRDQVPGLGRLLLIDQAGFAAITAAWAMSAYAAGGWHLLAGAALMWIAAERCTGVAHQLRNHAEHYGLWGARGSHLETQYFNARDVEAGPIAAWYFNHLNRHATHHALVGVPYYNLEAAHRYLRADFADRAVAVQPSRGYLAEVLAANRLARRGGFIVEAPDVRARVGAEGAR